MEPSGREKLLRETMFLAVSVPEDALEMVDQLLREDPDDIEALSLKGNILEGLNECIEARRCYEDILVINPNHVRTLIDIGDTYDPTEDLDIAMGFYDRAIGLLRRRPASVSLEEELDNAYCSKAAALREGGQLEEATKCLKEALQQLPTSERWRQLFLAVSQQP